MILTAGLIHAGKRPRLSALVKIYELNSLSTVGAYHLLEEQELIEVLGELIRQERQASDKEDVRRR